MTRSIPTTSAPVRRATAAVSVMLLGIASATAQTRELTRLTAADAAFGDALGFATDLEGHTAVVGAHSDDHSALTDAGSVYVFVRSANSWTQQVKLIAADAATNAHLGYGVAVSGDTLVASAPGSSATDIGAVYVFVRSGASWLQQQKLTPSDTSVRLFGENVAISGDTLVIGTSATFDPARPNVRRGSVHVFERSAGVWSEVATFFGTTGQLDGAVAIDGRTAVFGRDDRSPSSRVTVLDGAAGSWLEVATLVPSVSGGQFGSRLAIEGDTVIVGAPAQAFGDGAVFVFARSAGAWTEQARLLTPRQGIATSFGLAVDVSGDLAVLSQEDPPTAFVFERSGSTWNLLAELVPSATAQPGYGLSVSIDADTAIVGEDYNAAIPLIGGSAVVFTGRRTARLNEIYASHAGTDLQEFIELEGPPGQSLANAMVLIVDGDAPTNGTLERAWDLSSFAMPSDGFFVLGDAAVANVDLVIGTQDVLSEGTQTVYLVRANGPAEVATILGLVGSNLDPDADLTTTIPTLATIVSVVGLTDGGLSDTVYDGAGAIGPDGAAAPAGIFRGNDAKEDWCNNYLDFDPAVNLRNTRTPGAPNVLCCHPDEGATQVGSVRLCLCGGPFVSANPLDLTITGGTANQGGILAFATTFANVSLLGATLGPLPFLVSFPVTLDANGEKRVTDFYGHGGSLAGLTAYAQVLVLQTVSPLELGSSNTVALEFLF